MQVVPSGAALTFEYSSYDESSSLFVAMKVYDVTSTPTLVGSAIPMTHVFGGTYVGSFTPTAAHQYVVNKAVYTDGSYTTLDPTRSPGSESFLASSAAGGVLTPSDIENIVNGVWDEPQSAHTNAGTFGNYLDTQVSSRADQTTADDILSDTTDIETAVSSPGIAQQVWNAARSSYSVSGSFGEALQGVLSTARAGYLDNLTRLDVNVSTRAQQTTADAINSGVTYLTTNLTLSRIQSLDNLDATVSSRASQISVNALPTSAQIASAVWNEPLSSHTGAGTTGLQLGSIPTTTAPTATANAAAVWNAMRSSFTVSGSFGAAIDTNIGSRSSDSDMQAVKGSGFTTGADSLFAIVAKLNTLPTTAGDATAANQATILSQIATRSSQSSVNTLQSSVNAIPTNPLLTTDSRLNNLDVAVSSRASATTLAQAMGPLFTTGDDLHSIKAAVEMSVDLSPITNQLNQIQGSGFNSASDSLHAATAGIAAATTAANSAATAANAANASVATKASQASVNAIQTSVNAIPTNPALSTDSRFAFLDANVSSRADAVTLGQALGTGFNPATDSLHAIRVLVSALAPGDATISNQLAILAAISTLATAAGLSSLATAVAAIPINPVLTTDARIARLDVAVSSRASDADMQLVKGPSFDQNNDNLHAIKNSVPITVDFTPVLAELAKIEGAGFNPTADDLRDANQRAIGERGQIIANTEALLASGVGT